MHSKSDIEIMITYDEADEIMKESFDIDINIDVKINRYKYILK